MRPFLRLPGKQMMQVGLWVLLCNYGVAILSGGVSLYLASVLGEESFGIFSYAIVLSTIVFTITSFGADRTLVRDLVQTQDADVVMAASIRLRLKLAAVVGLAVVGWTLWGPSQLGGPLVGLLGAGMGLCLALAPNAWFDARREMHVVSLFQLAEKATFACMIFAMIRGPEWVLLAISVMFVLRLANCLMQWSVVRRRASLSLRTPAVTRATAELWRENRFICLAAVSNLALTHASQLMLSEQGGSRLGQYALAFQIVMLVQVAQNQLTRLLGPRVAQVTHAGSPRAEARVELLRLTAVAAALSLVLTAPVLLLGPLAIGHFLPGRFQEVGPALRILCLWTMIYGPALVVNRFLLGLRLTRPYFVITVSTGVLSIALSLYAVPRWGGQGAAASLLIAHSLSILAQTTLVVRTLRVPSDPTSNYDAGPTSQAA